MSDKDVARERTVTITLQTVPMDKWDLEGFHNALDGLLEVLHCLQAVVHSEYTLDEDEDELRDFHVYYEERYCRKVKATDEGQAREKVMNNREGEVVFFDTHCETVMEVNDQG